MWNQFGYHFWGMHWLWWIFWIILLLWIFLGLRPRLSEKKEKENPLDILKKRYAKGELTTEEYEERKKIIERDN